MQIASAHTLAFWSPVSAWPLSFRNVPIYYDFGPPKQAVGPLPGELGFPVVVCVDSGPVTVVSFALD